MNVAMDIIPKTVHQNARSWGTEGQYNVPEILGCGQLHKSYNHPICLLRNVFKVHSIGCNKENFDQCCNSPVSDVDNIKLGYCCKYIIIHAQYQEHMGGTLYPEAPYKAITIPV